MNMNEQLLNVQETVLNAARLSNISAISVAQENLSEFINSKLQHQLLESSSSSAAISAAAALLSTEKRVLVFSNHFHPETLREVVSMRLPLISFSNSDPNKLLAIRDSGSIIIFCESNQELLDTMIRAFRLCEDGKVLLPCIISWTGPLSYSEIVSLPSEQIIKNFLPQLKIPHKLDQKKISHLNGHESSVQIKQQQHKAMESVIKLSAEIDDYWNKKFKRSWPGIENYKADDADLILVTYGYHSGTAKAAVDILRTQGKKAGLVRIRVYRPFPKNSLGFVSDKKLAVLDFGSSPGAYAPLYQEIKHFSKHSCSFISLDKYLSEKDFIDIFTKLEKSEKEEIFWI